MNKNQLNPVDSTVNLPKYSSKKVLFKCVCGNIKEIIWKHFATNKTKTCGCKTGLVNKKSEYKAPTDSDYTTIDNQIKKNKLLLIDEFRGKIHKRSVKKLKFKCDCGNVKFIKYCDFIKTHKSCGLCNKFDVVGLKFGNLTVLESPQKLVGKYSNIDVSCKCDCGNLHKVNLSNLTRNRIKSCGLCSIMLKKWWDGKPPINSIIKERHGCNGSCIKCSYEFLINYFNGAYITPLSEASQLTQQINFKCGCGQIFQSNLVKVYHYKIISCGCISSSFSSANIEIGRFIETCNTESLYGKKEFKLDSYSFDVKSNKLLIEHNGLYFHSDKFKNHKYGHRDFKKYLLAKENNFDYLMLYEDEWINKKDIFKNIILNKLNLNNPTKIRPQKCEIKLITNKEINILYDKYHYIGKCNSKFNIGVYYQDELIAGLSIRTPSRQKAGDWEISRMVCNFQYRIYGIWSYLLNYIKNTKLISGKLITYSDNRLSDGDVYKKIGLLFDKKVRPDYYWVKAYKRFHKSTLRKNDNEKLTGKTEEELRISQGYRKQFDLGKIKWSINL